MAVWDVEEDTGRLQTRVNGAWTVRLVTDEETSPLELDDVTFLDSMETRISQHLILHLTTPTTNTAPTTNHRERILLNAKIWTNFVRKIQKKRFSSTLEW